MSGRWQDSRPIRRSTRSSSRRDSAEPTSERAVFVQAMVKKFAKQRREREAAERARRRAELEAIRRRQLEKIANCKHTNVVAVYQPADDQAGIEDESYGIRCLACSKLVATDYEYDEAELDRLIKAVNHA